MRNRNVEDSLDGIVLIRADSLDVGHTRGHIELDHGDASPVLTTVMLFFHQQIESAQAPCGIVITIPIVGEGLSQPDQSQSAFMTNEIAHTAHKRRLGKPSQQSVVESVSTTGGSNSPTLIR